MQLLVGIGVILLIAGEVSSAANITKRWVHQDLQEINNMRELLGIQPLKYDQSIADKFSNFACEQIGSGPSHRLMPMDLNDNANKLFALFLFGAVAAYYPQEFGLDAAKAANLRNELEEAMKKPEFSMFYLEALVPGQTTIGCIPKYCSRSVTQEEMGAAAQFFNGNTFISQTVCVLEPVGTNGLTVNNVQQMAPQLKAVAAKNNINLSSQEAALKAGAQSSFDPTMKEPSASTSPDVGRPAGPPVPPAAGPATSPPASSVGSNSGLLTALATLIVVFLH